ncbi:MAG: HEAT repeat domain-containing protein [Planctomycetota bacterium]
MFTFARAVSALVGVLTIMGSVRPGIAADKAQIARAIERGQAFLLKQSKSSAQGSLACYSLVKSGVDKSHPDIQKGLQEVLSRFRDGAYSPTSHHNYEAGVDAMFLEAVDRELYRPQLESIAKFLIQKQRSYGAWYYPSGEGAGTLDFGDTSITQYAILGLWAASRAGVEIPIETWERAAKWLLVSQSRDGGFCYHPVENPNQVAGATNSTSTMTVAGAGTLLVIRHVLFRDIEFDDGLRPSTPTNAPRRFGVLERTIEEREKEKAPKVKTITTMSPAPIDKALKSALRVISDHFFEPGNASQGMYLNYYFYGIERVGALLDSDKIGTHDWYNEGADELLKRQAADGSWTDSSSTVPSTALTLLFLSKATAGTIRKPRRAPQVGGGLLVGGRGLPDNLDTVQVNQGEVRKIQGPVDTLLADLEKSSDAQILAAQEAIVEKVQLDRPEELIGQITLLKRLSNDKRVEVRRTAIWALGRTGDISAAPFLIRGLTDGDESVVREASAALCILSRRPNGCGVPIDPTEGVAEDGSDEQRLAHLRKWGEASRKVWTDWYLKVRPYDERDDRNALKRKPQ